MLEKVEVKVLKNHIIINVDKYYSNIEVSEVESICIDQENALELLKKLKEILKV